MWDSDVMGLWGFRVSGVRVQGDLCGEVLVMSEDIQVCGVIVLV